MPQPNDGSSNTGEPGQPPVSPPNPEPIQPTSPQQPDNTNLLSQIESMIDGKLAGINAQLARANTVTAPQPVAPSEDELNKIFLEGNPARALSAVMGAQMAGINKDLADFKKDRAYSRIRDNIKANPKMAPYFDKIAPQLDATVDTLNVNQITQESIQLIANSLLGNLLVSGTLEAPKPNTPTPAAPLPGNIPVHLRPSAPIAPSTPKSEAEPELNENERALARRFGMSAKEFKESQDGDRMVITAIRKPEEKK